MSLNASPPAAVDLLADSCFEGRPLVLLFAGARFDVHGGEPLALVAEEGFDLCVDVFVAHGFDVVDDLGFEEEQFSGRWGTPAWGKKWGSRAATMPSMTSSPARWWSGCRRYCFHGS